MAGVPAVSVAVQLSFPGLEPEPAQPLTVLSYGCGQDSWTLLCLYVFDAEFRERYAPGRFLVVMAETGDEHPATYRHLEYTKKFCRIHGIEFVHVTPEMGYHSGKWQSLRGFYRATNTIGSKAFPKTCTDKLKLQPIYKFLEAWLGENFGVTVGRKKGFVQYAAMSGKVRVLIGIAKGEEKRMADPGNEPQAWKRAAVVTEYPLVDLGLDRAGCQRYIRSVGQPVPYPSNCILCPFMGEVELLWLYRFMREDYEDWVLLERAKLETNVHMGDRNLGVWGKKTLPEKLDETLAKFGHMTDAQLEDYKFSHGHCVMSKY